MKQLPLTEVWGVDDRVEPKIGCFHPTIDKTTILYLSTCITPSCLVYSQNLLKSELFYQN